MRTLRDSGHFARVVGGVFHPGAAADISARAALACAFSSLFDPVGLILRGRKSKTDTAPWGFGVVVVVVVVVMMVVVVMVLVLLAAPSDGP